MSAIGNQVRIDASLYDGAPAQPALLSQASVSGDTTQLFELVDRLAGDLMVRQRRGAGLPPAADRRRDHPVAAGAQGVPRRRAAAPARQLRLGVRRVPAGRAARQHLRAGLLPAGGGGGVGRTDGADPAQHRRAPSRLADRLERARPAAAGLVRGARRRASPTRPSAATATFSRTIPTTSRRSGSSPPCSTSTTRCAAARSRNRRAVFDGIVKLDPEFLCPI